MNARTLFRSVPGAGPASAPAQNPIYTPLPIGTAPAASAIQAIAEAGDKKKTGAKRDKRSEGNAVKRGSDRSASSASAHLLPQRSNAQASSGGG